MFLLLEVEVIVVWIEVGVWCIEMFCGVGMMVWCVWGEGELLVLIYGV